MMRSLFSGVAGLKNHQTKMDVIGNNIANVNTTGFKSGRVTFQDTLNQTLTSASSASGTRGGTNPKQIGLGVGIGSIDTIFTNGSVQSTGKNTDLCISGSGFFVVNDGNNRYYTRNGAFEFDEEGNYVMPGSGLKVQGWTGAADGTINTTGAVADIVVPSDTSMAATATTKAQYSKNLSADTGSTTIATMSLTLANGQTIVVPATNTESYAIGDSISGTVTAVTAKLSDGTVVNSKSATKNASPIAGTTINGMTVTLTDGTIVTTNATSTLAAKIGSKTASATVSGMTIGLNAGTLSAATAGTSYKVGGTLTGTVTNATTVTLSDGSTITGLSGLTAGATYTATVNSITGVTMSDGSTVGTVGTGTFKLNSVLSSNVESISNLTLADGSTVTTVGSGTFTAGQALSSPVSSYTVTSGSNVFEIPSTDTTNTYTVGGALPATTISSISLTLKNGTVTSGLSGLSYANGSTTYAPITTTVTVYDSLGSKHSVPLVLSKVAENIWSVSLVPNQADGVTTKIDGATVTGSLGNLTFDESTGKFKTGSGYSLSLSNYTNGAADSTIALDFSSMTQYAGESTAACTDYDGYAAGSLKSVSIDSAGVITGTFTNNEKRALAQVAMAVFNNPAGLEKSGSSLYSESNNSGKVQIATVNGSGSSVTPSSLEMSNVDLSNEFSDMIITQRGFQSNSKIITVSDEMLETLIGMKR
ncbi:MAG: flagellar hook-basal body complex protein [Selenomonadaceae bacterium]